MNRIGSANQRANLRHRRTSKNPYRMKGDSNGSVGRQTEKFQHESSHRGNSRYSNMGGDCLDSQSVLAQIWGCFSPIRVSKNDSVGSNISSGSFDGESIEQRRRRISDSPESNITRRYYLYKKNV